MRTSIMFICNFNANICYFFISLSLCGLFCLLFNTFFRNMYCVRAKKMIILHQNIMNRKFNLNIFIIKKV